MSLKQVGELTPLGGFYAAKGYAGIVTVHGECSLDMSMMSKERKSAVILSLKRGYSRGSSESEQYALYGAVCEKFGLKHSKVSNSTMNWLAIPDGENPREFRKRLLDVIEPMFQLTGEKLDRKQALGEGYHWHAWNITQVRHQQVLMFQRPQKVNMGVLGKALVKLMGEQPFDKVVEAINFVKEGGKISYTF